MSMKLLKTLWCSVLVVGVSLAVDIDVQVGSHENAGSDENFEIWLEYGNDGNFFFAGDTGAGWSRNAMRTISTDPMIVPPSVEPIQITRIQIRPDLSGRSEDGNGLQLLMVITLHSPGVQQGSIPFQCYHWEEGVFIPSILTQAYVDYFHGGPDSYIDCYPTYTPTLSETITLSTTISVPLDYNLPEFHVQDGTPTEGHQLSPALASLSGGGVVVCWTSENRELVRRLKYSVYCQIFENTGIERGARFQVNTNELGIQQTPDVAVLSNGDIVVVWNSNHLSGHTVMSMQFDSNGVPNAEGEVAQSISMFTSKPTKPVVTSFPSSIEFVVAWQSFGADGSYFGVYAKRHVVGDTTLVPFLVNTITLLDQVNPSIISYSTDGYIISWNTYSASTSSDIASRSFDGSDLPTTAEEKVNTESDANMERAPVVVRFSTNTHMVVWIDIGSGAATVQARVFDAPGVPSSSQFRVDSDVGLIPRTCDAVAMNDDTVVIVWGLSDSNGDNFATYAKRLSRHGDELQMQFLVNDIISPGEKVLPKVTKFGAWGFMVAWQTTDPDSESDITGKWYPDYKPVLF
eukprot:TRINITY_DN3283_c0_g1_i2.p1 TRINITY_DN3283_c0_g1~~TRINITY_DN3283_c0_g1_i2.p1  ORF type:complete len:594 (+),score=123.74 TRINITY_DN3283_c0_g1_i2:65-1783(+)